MLKWHYKLVFLGQRDYKDAEQVVNQLADEGWEVLTVSPSTAGDRVWMRRRRAD